MPYPAVPRAGTNPVLEDEVDVATCRVCGCTDFDACVGGCSWVPDPDELGDLCSTCADDLAIRAAVS